MESLSPTYNLAQTPSLQEPTMPSLNKGKQRKPRIAHRVARQPSIVPCTPDEQTPKRKQFGATRSQQKRESHGRARPDWFLANRRGNTTNIPAQAFATCQPTVAMALLQADTIGWFDFGSLACVRHEEGLGIRIPRATWLFRDREAVYTRVALPSPMRKSVGSSHACPGGVAKRAHACESEADTFVDEC